MSFIIVMLYFVSCQSGFSGMRRKNGKLGNPAFDSASFRFAFLLSIGADQSMTS